MKIKAIAIALLAILITTTSNCKKKISKYPFDMTGVWYAENTYLSGTVLVIEKNGQGKIFTYNPGGSYFSGFTENEKGKVKYKKDVLYIDNKKYTIFNEPVNVTGNDSIEAPDENDFNSEDLKKRKVLARMTLQQKGFATLKQSYTFNKYVDY